MTEIDPLNVPCRRCNAQIGDRCRTRSGRPDNPHRGRQADAVAAAQQKEPTMPQDAVPTFDAAAAGPPIPVDWNTAPPTITTPGAANPDHPEQDQQDRLPTDPALRRAALRQRPTTATPDEDTAPHVELDLDRLATDHLDRLATLVSEHLAAQAEQFTAELTPLPLPHPLGQTVWFRSRTGRWTAPATITATVDSLFQPNVDAGHLPPLSSDEHVHLTVQTPGIPGEVSVETADEHPDLVADDRLNKPAGGTFQEWDVPRYDAEAAPDMPTFEFESQPAGTWMWPL